MAQAKVGTVVSDKMEKTVVVKIVSKRRHPLYKKQMTRSKKFKASNETGAKSGDLVKIVEIKPVSKTVHFKVEEIMKSGKV